MGKNIVNIIVLTLIFTGMSVAVLWHLNPKGPSVAVVSDSERKMPVKVEELPPSASQAEQSTEQSVAAVDLTTTEAPVSEPAPAETVPQYDSSGHLSFGIECYKNNDLSKAVYHLREALRLDPGNNAAKDLLAKVVREAKVEEGFRNKEGSHFNVRYEGGESDVAGHVVAIILEEAYQKVGSDLGFHPEDSITTILYSSEQFRDVTRAPSWSGAIYDGKIRIPVGGLRERTDVLEKVIFHEYTHAVVHRMGGGRVPTWLNEGIAQYEEGRMSGREDLFRYLAAAEKLVPLNYLEGSFMGLNQEQAIIAYAEGLSAVVYIMEEYGVGMLSRFISSYKDGRGSEAAIRDTFQMTYKEFQDSWIRNLKKRYN